MAAENNIYCENDRVVRKYYQVRIKWFFRKKRPISLQTMGSMNHEVNLKFGLDEKIIGFAIFFRNVSINLVSNMISW